MIFERRGRVQYQVFSLTETDHGPSRRGSTVSTAFTAVVRLSPQRRRRTTQFPEVGASAVFREGVARHRAHQTTEKDVEFGNPALGARERSSENSAATAKGGSSGRPPPPRIEIQPSRYDCAVLASWTAGLRAVLNLSGAPRRAEWRRQSLLPGHRAGRDPSVLTVRHRPRAGAAVGRESAGW